MGGGAPPEDAVALRLQGWSDGIETFVKSYMRDLEERIEKDVRERRRTSNESATVPVPPSWRVPDRDSETGETQTGYK